MPVFSSQLLDYSSLGIGRRLRHERQRKGLTLRELAERVGVSEAKLSNVETAKVSLGMDELAELADALEVSLPTLFPRTGIQHYYVTRAADVAAQEPVIRRLIGPGPGPAQNHNVARLLAEPFAGKHVDPVLVEVRPLEERDLYFVTHDHEEFMFVLRGDVDVLLKSASEVTSERLKAGDALFFRSNIPHCIRSASDVPAEAISVTCSLPGIDPYDMGPSGRRQYRRSAYVNAIQEASDKIGLLRRTHGLTLAELAAEIGVGVRQLAQIESGEKATDVDLLLRFARRFRRPIEYFFASTLDAQPRYYIQRGDQIATAPVQTRKTRDLEGSVSANIFRPLAAGFPDRGMHPYYVQVTARSQHATPHEHYGQEFIYVLDGEVEFFTFYPDEVTEVLRPGDSLFLESGVPHMLRGASRNPYASTYAEIIDVFWTPLGASYLFGE